MSKIRINDLARELEVKSKAILDVLDEVGVTEKKTHSSSLEDHEAEKVRSHFRAAAGESQTVSKASRPSRPDEIKTKIDLSNISRPGDVLNAIRKQQAPATVAPPSVRPVAAATPAAPSVSTVKAPPPPSSAVVAPRMVVPSATPRPTFSVPPPAVAPPPASAGTLPAMPVPAPPVHSPAATPPVAQAAAPTSLTTPPAVPPQPLVPAATKPAAPVVASRAQAPSPR